MNEHASIKFSVVIVLQILALCALILFKYAVLVGGTEAFLHSVPFDPRDPIRGDYVMVDYDISRVPSDYVVGDTALGETVFVPLSQGSPYWNIAGPIVKKIPDEVPDNIVYIKGTVKSRIPSQGLINSGDLVLDYGIEQIFISEGTGKDFPFIDKEMGVIVMIGKGGDTVARQIYVDNRPWPQTK